MAYKKSFRAASLFISAIISTTCSISAQQISLSKSIRIAQENSFDAQMARYSYLASYWTYRSFQAQLLPAVNIRGDIANFDHSMVAARNFEDGRVAYVDNNSMSNSLTLSVDQEIAATGGTVSLQSYLYRLDQFTYNEKTWRTRQTLWGAKQMLTQNCCQTIHEEWYVFDSFHLCTEAFDL